MTDETPQRVPFTTEELEKAVNAEQMEYLQAQMNYLLGRAGDLRANLNRVIAERDELQARLADLQKPKKQTDKKSSSIRAVD